jgi:hypothetical protein
VGIDRLVVECLKPHIQLVKFKANSIQEITKLDLSMLVQAVIADIFVRIDRGRIMGEI